MSFILQPWHIVLLVLSAMFDGERDRAIDYLLMENQVDESINFNDISADDYLRGTADSLTH
jgi:hypothetical protein